MCEPPNERRSLGAEAVREQGVLSGPDSLPERVRARVTEADVFGVKSLASERRGRVCHPAYHREGMYICVLPCLCRRKLRRQITGDAMYRIVEIAQEEEGCRVLQEGSP